LMSQVLCLRIAVILHHARVDLPSHLVTIQKGRTRHRVQLPKAWALQHLRTLHLLQEEARRWDTNGPSGVTLELTS
ncbi:MAG: hypothetical protein KAX73_04135, partial [Aquabacterium sp.]|nr:hypothetical protein [Aquabacterium sp.]